MGGCLFTVIRVIDDLGMPLMPNSAKLLASQTYLWITTIGIEGVDGYVVCVILVALCAQVTNRVFAGRSGSAFRV